MYIDYGYMYRLEMAQSKLDSFYMETYLFLTWLKFIRVTT